MLDFIDTIIKRINDRLILNAKGARIAYVDDMDDTCEYYKTRASEDIRVLADITRRLHYAEEMEYLKEYIENGGTYDGINGR